MQLSKPSSSEFKSWQGLPYYPISQFYRQKFGEKVYKISVSTATSCPNREGLRGMKTCNFCDVWGSAAYPELREQPLVQQIEKTRLRLKEMYNTQAFLVYFQAYTTTFTKVRELRTQFELASKIDHIKGLVVGTRPDCLSDRLFELFNEYRNKKFFVAAEFGVQSFEEEQLIWMRRGHTARQSVTGIQRLKQACPDVNIGVHLIFGVPGESNAQIVASARLINSLPVDNVKLHHLHVLKNTKLEEDYLRGDFVPATREAYFEKCRVFLEHLSPRIAVHRLSALSTRPDELIAPDWTAKKMETYQGMLDYLNGLQSYQGKGLTGEPDPITVPKWNDSRLYDQYLSEMSQGAMTPIE